MSSSGRKGALHEKEMEEYLKFFRRGKNRTIRKKAINFRTYCEWIKKTPEQLINEYAEARKSLNTLQDWKRDVYNNIVQFYNYLIKEGYQINTARTTPSGILGFYSENCETIKGVTKQFAPVQIPTDEYVFTQEVLRKVYYYADLEGQTLLSLAVCLGYSASDFLSLETETIYNLVRKATDEGLDFIQFIGNSRTKTSVQPRSHLTTEAIHCLTEYLPYLHKKFGELPTYLWCTQNKDKHLTIKGLNQKLKRLMEKANIETYGKKVRFHCIRKLTYSTLQAKNVHIAKVITAKKVSASDLTYVPDLDKECLRVFKESYKNFALNGDITGKTKKEQNERIKLLEETIKALEKENLTNKTRIDLLQKSHKTEIDELKEKMQHIEESNATKFSTIVKIMKKQGLLKDEES